jgi:hypothetical protein
MYFILGVYLGIMTTLYRVTSDSDYLTWATLTATTSVTGYFGNSPALVVTQQDDITAPGDAVQWRDVLFRNLIDFYKLLTADNLNTTLQSQIQAFFQANYNQIMANAKFDELYAANWFGEIPYGSDWGTGSVLCVLLGALVVL